MILTTNYPLNQVPAPNLPLATKQYDPNYQEGLNNVLRLYFNRLNALMSLIDIGPAGFVMPYGAFFDTTTQSTTANTNTPITLNSTSYSNLVTVSGSKITVLDAGLYNLQFSVQLSNSDNAPQDAEVWLRKNGVDVAQSNSRFGLSQRKSVADPFHVLGSLNLFINLAANDYVELVWRTTNASVVIAQYTVVGRPNVPSVIATMTFVSGSP